MEFCCGAEVMWVAAGDDAGAAWATAAGGQEGLGVLASAFCEGVDIRGSCGLVSVASVVVPADIVGDENDEVGAFRGGGLEWQKGDEEKNESFEGSQDLEWRRDGHRRGGVR